MKNRGFTIIELVSIILILAAILLVSFPAITNLLKADDSKKYDAMVKDLCLAGEAYIKSNLDSFSSVSTVGATITISIDELITYGSVKPDTKNPNTNNSISGDSLTYVVQTDRSLNCSYIDN